MDHLTDVGPGWHRILLALHYDLLAVDPNYEVDQLKEKFGGLRVYLRYHHLACEKLIMEATRLSHETCEECGEPGETAGPGWIKTLCELHRIQRNADPAKRWENSG
jgi:hypothetical protein